MATTRRRESAHRSSSSSVTELRFPTGFRWGTASSAYQNEGNNTNSDWWVWEEGEGHIAGRQRSGRACDWWGDGFAVDVEWMSRLNLNAHRMSVEWSRIEPEEGRFDAAAIDRYRFMLRALREHGIEPMVTLHHFSNPIWLAARGGWERRDVTIAFERFVTHTVRALADLCDLWITINEPTVYAVLGWIQSPGGDARHQTTFPPGKNDVFLARRVLEHMLHAHAAAYHAIHRIQPDARVGIAHNMQWLDPRHPDSRLDRIVRGLHDRLLNDSVLDAVLRGRQPRLGRRTMPALANTVDFIGINYYGREFVAFDAGAPLALFSRREPNPDGTISDGRFSEVHAPGLGALLRRVAASGKPIRITENGVPDRDDRLRPAFLRSHLTEVADAIADGVPVEGYYHWTLTDNFEWAEGWNLRFGLIALDPVTQTRSERPSASQFASICRENGLGSG